MVEWRLNHLRLRHRQLPDDEDADGPWNFGLLPIQPPDAASSPQNILLNLVAVKHLNCMYIKSHSVGLGQFLKATIKWKQDMQFTY